MITDGLCTLMMRDRGAIPDDPKRARKSEPRLLTPDDCAKTLAVSRSMIYALLKRGDIRAVYIGRLPRVEPAELERYIEGSRR
jgi:excisionase family DNA binding protein